MSTNAGMPRDIDRILDAWFAEGPTLAADQVVGAALGQTERVPQAVPILRRDAGRRPMWLLLAATVAIAITLVGFGFAAGIFRIDRPRPGPIESPAVIPSPSEGVPASPSAWRIYTSERNGYQVAIPPTWTAADGNGLTYFRSEGHTALVVSVGNRAGLVWVCSWEPCQAVRVDGIDELGANLQTVATRIGRIPEQTVDIALDGWPARIKAPAANRFLEGPPANVNIFGMLDGRPVVLRFNYSYRVQDIPTATQAAVIESFRFMD